MIYYSVTLFQNENDTLDSLTVKRIGRLEYNGDDGNLEVGTSRNDELLGTQILIANKKEIELFSLTTEETTKETTYLDEIHALISGNYKKVTVNKVEIID